MVVVLSYLAASLLVSAPFGVAVYRHWRHPAPLPEPYTLYRPGLQEHVVIAESAVRAAYRELAPLYDTPTVTGPPS